MNGMILTPGRHQQLTLSMSAVTTSTAIPATIATVWCNGGGAFIKTGTNPVSNTATDFLVPNNFPIQISINAGDLIAARSDTVAGHLMIAW